MVVDQKAADPAAVIGVARPSTNSVNGMTPWLNPAHTALNGSTRSEQYLCATYDAISEPVTV